MWRLIAVLCVALIGLGAWLLVRPKPLTEAEILQALMAELRPVTLKNCTLERFGGPNDGGYLMCGNLLGDIEVAYSYGIGSTDDWGCDVSSKYRVNVHEYDCFDTHQPMCSGGRFLFHAECIGPRRETIESRPFDTLTNQLSKNGDSRKRLLVKMDVEGAEWNSLLATSDAVLERIDQLPMELHMRVTPPGTEDRSFVELVRKLKRTFHLAHLHYNNSACVGGVEPFPAWAFQVLFVNKRIGVLDPAAPAPQLPHPLDARDNPTRPDCQTLGTTDSP
jgi:hypothetical protein